MSIEVNDLPLIINKKFNQDYRGEAQICQWHFSVPLPDQAGARLAANQFIESHKKALEDEGHILL